MENVGNGIGRLLKVTQKSRKKGVFSALPAAFSVRCSHFQLNFSIQIEINIHFEHINIHGSIYNSMGLGLVGRKSIL